ncbi:ATP-binding protein [Streptomyces sp. SID8499]|nr:ATP-binding protein [Streptomyces sp. SID8499]
MTRARLTGWSVDEDTCDTAALVVSELVTNAIVHTASRRVVCELSDGAGLVRIAVRDEGCAPGEPHPSPQRPEEEHGRGLMLVEALCHAWGTREHGPGLVVWAELPRTAAGTVPAEAASADMAAAGTASAEEAEPGDARGPASADGREPRNAGSHRAMSDSGREEAPGHARESEPGGDHGPGLDRGRETGTPLDQDSGTGTARAAGTVSGVGRQAGPGDDRAGRAGREARDDLGWGAPRPVPDRRPHPHPHRDTEDSSRTGRAARHGAPHATTHGTGAVWL